MMTTRFFAIAAPLFAAATMVGLSCGGESDPVVPLPDDTSSTSSGGGSGGGGVGGGSQTTAGIISSSSESAFETSPAIAVAEGGRVMVAWVGQPDEGPSHIGYAFSSDGGATWSAPTIIASTDGSIYDSPDLVLDRAGTFHLSFLGYKRDASGGQVMVATASSADGTFGAPVVISDPEAIGIYERPRSVLTKKGSVMVTYGQLVDGYSSIVVATSYQGEEWERVVIQKGTPEEHWGQPYPCAAPPGGAAVGRTWITHVRDGRVRLIYSDDDGVTWAGGIELVGEGAGPGPTCVGDGNELWISFGIRAPNKSFGELAVVGVAHSTDGGDTFIDFVEAHDGEAAQFFSNHQLALEQDGALNLAYYSGAGQGDSVGAFRRTRWLQAEPGEGGGDPGAGGSGGGPEGKPSEVVHQPVGFELARTSDEWIGDSIGFAWSEGKLYSSYVDNAEVVSHVAFQRIDEP